MISETIQLAWWIYGQTLYYSDEAYECTEKESILMDCMSIYLLMQTCKVVLFSFALSVIIIILCCKKRQQWQA